MKKIIPFVIVLGIVVWTACTKKEETLPYVSPDTPAELIQAGGWNMTGARYKVDNGDWVDFYGGIQTCLRDNILSFPTEDVYVKDEGPSKCDPFYPQKVEDGNWAFKWNESKILFITPLQDTAITVYDTTEQTLLSLTENEMKIMYTESAGGARIRTNEITYRH